MKRRSNAKFSFFDPATSDDLAITYALTEDAMRSYVEQTWGTYWEAEDNWPNTAPTSRRKRTS